MADLRHAGKVTGVHAMTNAEPTSTDSTIERAEKAGGQPPLVAVSEENLAALMRATSATPEPEVPQAEAAPVIEVNEAPAVAEPVAVTPVEAPAPVEQETEPAVEHAFEQPVEQSLGRREEQREYPAASLPAEP